MPSEPVISIHELARNCPGTEYRCLKQVSGAIRQAATPTPMTKRASNNCASDPAAANATQPSTATSRKAISTRLAPSRSSAWPSGSCITANPAK